jgi:hypothetical protein
MACSGTDLPFKTEVWCYHCVEVSIVVKWRRVDFCVACFQLCTGTGCDRFVFCVEVAGSEKFSFDLIDFLLLYL